jgi:superfamily II DNA or RNA helicase
MQLREYQQECLDRALSAIASGENPLVVLPTGSGKTHIIIKLIELYPRSLTLSHRIELIIKPSLDLDPAKIGWINADRTQDYDRPYQLATIQSVCRRQNVLDKIVPEIIIIDEAHRARSASYDRITDYAKKHKIPIVGFTATPTRLDGKPLSTIFDRLVVGITAKDAIASGYLSNFHVFVPERGQIKIDDIDLNSNGDYNLVQLQSRANKPTLVADAVTEWLQKADGRSTIVFTTGSQHSNSVLSAYLKAGISAVVIDSKTPNRAALFADFMQGIFKVLIACQIPIEGVDLPNCECIQCLRPTASLVYWWQAIGRGLRPSGRDTIVLDHAGNSYRLALPCDLNNWSLGNGSNSNVTWTLTGAQRSSQQIIICDNCQAVLQNSTLKCTFCNLDLINSKPYNIPQIIDGKLKLFDKVDYDRLEQLLKSGLKNHEIVSQGYSKSTVSRHRQLLKIKDPRFANYDDVDSLIKSGYSNKYIIETTGTDKNCVHRRRVVLGIVDPNANKPVDRSLLESLIRSGKTNKQIVAQLNCAKSVVVNCRSKLQIKDPRWKHAN